MMKTNFSLLFYLKKQKNYISGNVRIYMRITVQGKRAEIATSRDCEPGRWNARAGRVIGSKEVTRPEIRLRFFTFDHAIDLRQ
jgi:hypothetical protein